MFTVFSKNALVPLLLRLALATIFIYHGALLVGGQANDWGATWNKAPEAPPRQAQLAVSWGELAGGIVLAVGLLTRLGAIGIIVIMAGAIATVHWPHGFDIRGGGFEYNFAIIIMCLCLILGGPGPYSLDRFIRLERH